MTEKLGIINKSITLVYEEKTNSPATIDEGDVIGVKDQKGRISYDQRKVKEAYRLGYIQTIPPGTTVRNLAGYLDQLCCLNPDLAQMANTAKEGDIKLLIGQNRRLHETANEYGILLDEPYIESIMAQGYATAFDQEMQSARDTLESERDPLSIYDIVSKNLAQASEYASHSGGARTFKDKKAQSLKREAAALSIKANLDDQLRRALSTSGSMNDDQLSQFPAFDAFKKNLDYLFDKIAKDGVSIDMTDLYQQTCLQVADGMLGTLSFGGMSAKRCQYYIDQARLFAKEGNAAAEYKVKIDEIIKKLSERDIIVN